MNIGRAVGLFLAGILLSSFLSPLTAQQRSLPYVGHGLDVDIYGGGGRGGGMNSSTIRQASGRGME
jgi:hypothetical protein